VFYSKDAAKIAASWGYLRGEFVTLHVRLATLDYHPILMFTAVDI
jgi:hypothetical protein